MQDYQPKFSLALLYRSIFAVHKFSLHVWSWSKNMTHFDCFFSNLLFQFSLPSSCKSFIFKKDPSTHLLSNFYFALYTVSCVSHVKETLMVSPCVWVISRNIMVSGALIFLHIIQVSLSSWQSSIHIFFMHSSAMPIQASSKI